MVRKKKSSLMALLQFVSRGSSTIKHFLLFIKRHLMISGGLRTIYFGEGNSGGKGGEWREKKTAILVEISLKP